jgi:mandelate racemase
LLGAARKPIRAYNSNGLGLIEAEAAADEAEELLAGGFEAIKMRLGRPTLEADLAAIRAVRRRVPHEIKIMADFNQALTPAEAKRRCHAIDGEGLYWIEEPIRHDDYAGCAELARELETPIQIGENFAGPQAMAAAISARAADYMMPDLERIGGVTGWQQAAALGAAAGIEISSHLFPEASAHLLAATSTAHWLEHVGLGRPDPAAPQIVDGCARCRHTGDLCGLERRGVARYRLT